MNTTSAEYIFSYGCSLAVEIKKYIYPLTSYGFLTVLPLFWKVLCALLGSRLAIEFSLCLHSPRNPHSYLRSSNLLKKAGRFFCSIFPLVFSFSLFRKRAGGGRSSSWITSGWKTGRKEWVGSHTHLDLTTLHVRLPSHVLGLIKILAQAGLHPFLPSFALSSPLHPSLLFYTCTYYTHTNIHNTLNSQCAAGGGCCLFTDPPFVCTFKSLLNLASWQCTHS